MTSTNTTHPMGEGAVTDADGTAFTDIPQIAVNAEDINTALNYIVRLQDFASFLANTRMTAIKSDTTANLSGKGTPFGGFDDAIAQWSTLQTATANMATSLTNLQQKLATLKAGTESIMKNYKDAESRNATTQAQINAIFDQTSAATSTGIPSGTPNA
jgi:hypothetical protein